MDKFMKRCRQLSHQAAQGDDMNSYRFFDLVEDAITETGLSDDQVEANLILLLGRKLAD